MVSHVKNFFFDGFLTSKEINKQAITQAKGLEMKAKIFEMIKNIQGDIWSKELLIKFNFENRIFYYIFASFFR